MNFLKMTIVLTFCLLTFAFVGMGATYAQPQTIAKIQSGKVTLQKKKLKSKFQNGVSIKTQKVQKQKGSYYLVQTGTVSKNSCYSRRIKLSQAQSTLQISDGKLNWEECSGQNCTSCYFKDSGGCGCSEPVTGGGASICNHKIGIDLKVTQVTN